MVSIMRTIFSIGNYCWLVAVIICILTVQRGNCLLPELQDFPSNILYSTENDDEFTLINQFDQIELNNSKIKVNEIKEIIQILIEEFNTRYSCTLSLSEACTLMKQQTSSMLISNEDKDLLNILINYLQSSTQEDQDKAISRFYQSASIHTQMWKGQKNKKEKKQAKDIPELPANVYIGALEILTGALICIVPYPGVWRYGVAVIGDGTRRVIDGFAQASDEKRTNPK